MDLDRLRREWKTIPGSESVAEPARAYAAGMAVNSFDYYFQRAAAMGVSGERMLDAGCGTGTWAFAFASMFEWVDGCDIATDRVALAIQMAEQFGFQNTKFKYGSVLDLPYKDERFDFLFCYGVVISYIPIQQVLQEYYRVLKPGGKLYICLNGIGWSMYLRDVRGAEDESKKLKGLRGIYNTLVSARFGFDPDYVKNAFERLPPNHTIRKAQKLERVQGGADSVLAALDDPVITEMADAISRECGPEFRATFADDLVRIGAGNRHAFSNQRAGRGYEPDFIEKVLDEIGFSDFRWAPEGRLFDMSDSLVKRDKLHNGHLKNWEFMAIR